MGVVVHDGVPFIQLPQTFCTGSSIMPHKVNPDVLELIRGKTARVVGNLQTLLVLVKGLPLAYNRDLQEDKLPLFDSVDTVKASLEVAAPLVEGTRTRSGGHLAATGSRLPRRDHLYGVSHRARTPNGRPTVASAGWFARRWIAASDWRTSRWRSFGQSIRRWTRACSRFWAWRRRSPRCGVTARPAPSKSAGRSSSGKKESTFSRGTCAASG